VKQIKLNKNERNQNESLQTINKHINNCFRYRIIPKQKLQINLCFQWLTVTFIPSTYGAFYPPSTSTTTKHVAHKKNSEIVFIWNRTFFSKKNRKLFPEKDQKVFSRKNQELSREKIGNFFPKKTPELFLFEIETFFREKIRNFYSE
jgi:hypothetical protein